MGEEPINLSYEFPVSGESKIGFFRMAKPKGSKKTGGRKKGSKNKISTDIKAAYLEAFEKRGGVQGLLDWAAESTDSFYAQVSKMLPKEIDASVTATVNLPDLIVGGKRVKT